MGQIQNWSLHDGTKNSELFQLPFLWWSVQHWCFCNENMFTVICSMHHKKYLNIHCVAMVATFRLCNKGIVMFIRDVPSIVKLKLKFWGNEKNIGFHLTLKKYYFWLSPGG